MSILVVKYKLSEEAQKSIFIETGQKPNRVQEVEIDLVELTPEQRAHVVEVGEWQLSGDKIGVNLGYQATRLYDSISFLEDRAVADKWIKAAEVFFDRILSNDEILLEVESYAKRRQVLLKEAAPRVAEAQAEIERLSAEKARLQVAADLLFEQAEAISGDEEALITLRSNTSKEVLDFNPKNRLHTSTAAKFYDLYLKPFEETRKEARKRQLEAERNAWIEQHGSERLKLAVKHGHPVDRIFALEYAKAKYPGWTVDFFNNATWSDRTNPPLSELKAIEAAEAETDKTVHLVWLTSPAQDQPNDDRYWDDYEGDFEKGPALVIRKFLDKYDLVKVI